MGWAREFLQKTSLCGVSARFMLPYPHVQTLDPCTMLTQNPRGDAAVLIRGMLMCNQTISKRSCCHPREQKRCYPARKRMFLGINGAHTDLFTGGKTHALVWTSVFYQAFSLTARNICPLFLLYTRLCPLRTHHMSIKHRRVILHINNTAIHMDNIP